MSNANTIDITSQGSRPFGFGGSGHTFFIPASQQLVSQASAAPPYRPGDVDKAAAARAAHAGIRKNPR